MARCSVESLKSLLDKEEARKTGLTLAAITRQLSFVMPANKKIN